MKLETVIKKIQTTKKTYTTNFKNIINKFLTDRGCDD